MAKSSDEEIELQAGSSNSDSESRPMKEKAIDINGKDSNSESSSEIEDEEQTEADEIDAEKRKFRKEITLLLSYTFWVICYCLVMYGAHGDEDNYFNLHGMSQELLQRDFDFGQGEKNFEAVSDVRDMYLFMRGPLVNFLLADTYVTSRNKEIPLPESQINVPNYYNRLIGGIRLRQRRMPFIPCDLAAPFDKLARMKCFDKLTHDDDFYTSDEYLNNYQTKYVFSEPDEAGVQDEPVEEAEPTPPPEPAPAGNSTTLPPTPAAKNLVLTRLENSKTYRTEEETEDFPFTGLAYTYDPDGYVADLPLNKAQALAMLDQLERTSWVSPGTRMVVIRFWTYNPILRLVYAATLLFEMPAGGGVLPRIDHHALKLDRYAGDGWQSGAQLAFEAIFYVLLFVFVIVEFYEMKTEGIKAYCSDGWNLFDWTNLTLFFATGIVRLYVSSVVKSLDIGSGDKYVEISSLVTLVKIEDYCNSVSLFLLLFKFFKMLGGRFPRVNLFGRLISTASLDLLLLVSLLMLFTFTFAFAGYVAFSSSNFDFRGIQNSLLTCIRGVFGDLNFETMYVGFGSQRSFAGFFFFAFQSIVLLIMINVFIAVVNESWEEVGKEDEKQSLSSLYSKLLGQKTKVDKAEFFQALLKVDPSVSQARSDMIFKILDKDKSGYIEEDEMHEVKYFISHPAGVGSSSNEVGKLKKSKSWKAAADSKMAEHGDLLNLLKPQDVQLASLRQFVNHKFNILLAKLTAAGLIDDEGHDIACPTEITGSDPIVTVPEPSAEKIKHMMQRRMTIGFGSAAAPPQPEEKKEDAQTNIERKMNDMFSQQDQSKQAIADVANTLATLNSAISSLDNKVSGLPSTIKVQQIAGAVAAPSAGAVIAAPAGAAAAAKPAAAAAGARKSGFWARVRGNGEKYYHALDGRKIPDGPEAIAQYLEDKKARKNDEAPARLKKQGSKRSTSGARSHRSSRRRRSRSSSRSASRSSSSRSGSTDSRSESSYTDDSYDRRGRRR